MDNQRIGDSIIQTEAETGSIGDIIVLFVLLFAVTAVLGACVIFFLSSQMIETYKGYLLLIYSLVYIFIFIIYISSFCRKRTITVLDRLGITFEFRISISVLIYTLVTIALCSLNIFFHFLIKNGMNSISLPDVRQIYEVRYGILTPMAISVVVLMPILEECMYRGFSYPILRKRYGISRGIIISSILFSIFQPNNQPLLVLNIHGLFQSFLLGVFLNIIFEREENLLWCILFHSFTNIIICVVGISISYI